MHKQSRILITGADGFIGSHLTERLLAEGHRVRALAQYNSFNYHGWLEDISATENLETVTGDIRDPHQCEILVKDIDIIFHLAALIAIPFSYQAPDSYVDTNIRGTLNICQAARNNGNIRVIHTSTSEVYGTAKYVPIDESHPRQPQSPYSASKIAADAMALSFWHSFSLPVTVARPFNTYGPRQSARAIIPSIIIQVLSGSSEVMIGNTAPTRDMNFVTDTVAGLTALANCEEAVGKEVNICTGTEVSVGDIASVIMELTGSTARLADMRERHRPDSSEVYRLCGDNSLITSLTGWKPEHNLKRGIEKTIEWFRDAGHLNRYKADRYNI
jgi:NAD dependent epimerase/dehydratase